MSNSLITFVLNLPLVMVTLIKYLRIFRLGFRSIPQSAVFSIVTFVRFLEIVEVKFVGFVVMQSSTWFQIITY